MTSPGNIELDYDTATAAAAELNAHAVSLENLAAKFQDAVDEFKANASLDGDVLPASKATLALLVQQAAKVRSVIAEVTLSVGHAGAALDARVATAQNTEAESASVIEHIDVHAGGSEGTP